MNPEELLKEASNMQEELTKNRRYLHTHPETGFDLTETKAYVKRELTDMGYTPIDCGKAGLTALASGKKAAGYFYCVQTWMHFRSGKKLMLIFHQRMVICMPVDMICTLPCY